MLTRRSLIAQSIAIAAMPTVLSAQAADMFVLDEIRLIDGISSVALDNARIVVSAGRIAAAGEASQVQIPAGARIVKGTGKTVMPGLIGGHVHLGGYDGLIAGPAAQNRANILRQLDLYLRYGVTSVTSLGTNKALVYDVRKDLTAGTAFGADIFVADHGIGVPKGAPPAALGPDQLDRPETTEQAREAVRAAASRGTNLIKLWLDDFQQMKLVKMQPDIYEAAIDEAHKANLPAYVHIHDLADAKAVLKVGADVLAHGVRDVPVDAEFIDLMKKNDAWYIPTLTVDDAFVLFAEHPDTLSDPVLQRALHPDLLKQFQSAEWREKQVKSPALASWKAGLAMNQRNTKAAYDAGLNVGYGTDSGAMPLRVPGFAEHRELELLVQAGFTPSQAIISATSQAASLLRIDDRGVIATGKLADLVMVDGNPLVDIKTTRQIRAVWKRGREVIL